jgi:hypothetical protein
MTMEQVTLFGPEWRGRRIFVKQEHSLTLRHQDSWCSLARWRRRVFAAPVSASLVAWPCVSTPPWPRLPYSAAGMSFTMEICLLDGTYPSNNFLDFLLMTFHLQNASNLH